MGLFVLDFAGGEFFERGLDFRPSEAHRAMPHADDGNPFPRYETFHAALGEAKHGRELSFSEKARIACESFGTYGVVWDCIHTTLRLFVSRK